MIKYLSYLEAVEIHFELMRYYGEERIGLFSPELVKSALARPQNAAAYEGADLIRQTATLFFGFIKNHPWQGGNKRTATALMDSFLFRNGVELEISFGEAINLSLKVEADEWKVDEIENWLRSKAGKIQ